MKLDAQDTWWDGVRDDMKNFDLSQLPRGCAGLE